ncbi:hypothetical protein CLAFUW4_12146 [Fulvia fulva]|uniref:Uncharacterized protein n=1 Tax=Passalora fulva TaxID=5499 RepID=A0A9Q8PDF0_PASFU|nr:uncharacterized protein CLAFUR5_11185 [Fulvia fulva]KAK4617714.1 hypothetical protein CLAFUR4_12151 [Fulvia fulva]KAK4619131.1 hypothetical protein CLAFUR0_12162 [Fulvia fulva]UJO20519.1 hypothetical protein CLAFUR5_11185 [Fulvia fulva]WPV18281.1 hypothetical protein CLAFUW4_12146 [Fulvia fulva]WPV33576.1 hypothetical protein CLAFUW7_12153 [Fulvia fulva]
MCTQELIWCSCGHGEFLPINLCTQGQRLGTCWTIVHGDHNIVLASRCSYCQAGLNRRRPLRSPRPRGDVARGVEANGEVDVEEELERLLEGSGDEGVEVEVGALAAQTNAEMDGGEVVEGSVGEFSFDDVMSTDWEKGFELGDELWNFDDFGLADLNEKEEAKE